MHDRMFIFIIAALPNQEKYDLFNFWRSSVIVLRIG